MTAMAHQANRVAVLQGTRKAGRQVTKAAVLQARAAEDLRGFREGARPVSGTKGLLRATAITDMV
jgi:hypothetical protein